MEDDSSAFLIFRESLFALNHCVRFLRSWFIFLLVVHVFKSSSSSFQSSKVQKQLLLSVPIRFRLNFSTNNTLMPIVENIQTQLDDGKYSAGVFVDLKKAFDTVDHNIHN